MMNVFSSVENGANNQITYSLFEIIFWYSAFVIVLIIFIVYLKNSSSRKRNLNNISHKIKIELDKYSSLIQKINNGNKIKTDEFAKTMIVLASLDSSFIELKESTKLGDFDKLLEESKSLSQYLKSEKHSKEKYSISNLETICAKLTSIYEEIEVVKTLVK